MKIIYTCTDLINTCSFFWKTDKKIGFVPTMGALHAGHLSLVEQSKLQCDITIASIFVNPLQFNDKNDLVAYPRTETEDIKLLKSMGCDIVFIPQEQDLYANWIKKEYTLGMLDTVLEGFYRPDHFQGVANVVHLFFNLIKPKKAFFGEKDFQQLAVIKHIVKTEQIPVQIIPCPTVREPDGLAMSSRNKRLSKYYREQAGLIYTVLCESKKQKTFHTVHEVIKWAKQQFEQHPHFKLEYVSIVNADTLQEIQAWNETSNSMMLIAVYLENVRLIDNMLLADK